MEKPLVVTPSESGWINKATEALGKGLSVEIQLDGREAEKIVQRIQRTVAGLPVEGIFGAVSKLVPLTGALQVPVAAVVPVLASIGAVGGAAGAVAYVAGLAVSHGHSVEFSYKLNNPLDITDDTLSIMLKPKAS